MAKSEYSNLLGVELSYLQKNGRYITGKQIIQGAAGENWKLYITIATVRNI